MEFLRGRQGEIGFQLFERCCNQGLILGLGEGVQSLAFGQACECRVWYCGSDRFHQFVVQFFLERVEFQRRHFVALLELLELVDGSLGGFLFMGAASYGDAAGLGDNQGTWDDCL